MEQHEDNRTHRLQLLPENVVSIDHRHRHWVGAHVGVHEMRCDGRVTFPLRCEKEALLFALIDEVGRYRVEPRIHPARPCDVEYQPRHMTWVPKGMDLWLHSDHITYLKDATVVFELDVLEQRFEESFSRAALECPRIRMTDGRIAQIVQMLSDVLACEDPSVRLYGDSLIAGLVACLMSPGRPIERPGKGLAPWQLRRVTDYLNDRLPERVDLADLSRLACLSPAHFSRAFKLSTGLAPYRWQLDMRISRARDLLSGGDSSLEEVAEACGFADGPHFARTFKRFSGCTPSEWRRQRP